MNIAALSRNSKRYSARRLVEASTKHGPLVMEVNSIPGLERIEAATGKDVAAMVVAFIEKLAASGNTNTGGRG